MTTSSVDHTVSVIIPARNAAMTLAKTLSSILPSPAVGEIIVIDDKSTDATAQVAVQLGDARLRVIAGPGTGIAGALNAGFDAARLPYILRCDADDLVRPATIAPRVLWLEDHPEVCAMSAGFETFLNSDDGHILAQLANQGGARDVTEMLLDGQSLTHFCTWLTRRDALRDVGGARSWFPTAEDIDLQYRLAGTGRVWHDPQHLVYQYRLHDGSITHSRNKAHNAFYDDQARRFALQRRDTGTDDLMAGRPPVFDPDGSSPADQKRNSPKAQASDLLRGQAWRSLEDGHKRRAIGQALHAIRLNILDLRGWKNAIGIVIHALHR